MNNFISLAIICLSIADLVINHRLQKIRVVVRVERREDLDKMAILGVQKLISQLIHLNATQMAVRILLMTSWIFNTLYFREGVAFCFFFGVGYSLLVFLSFQKIKQLRWSKNEFITMMERITNEEQK